MATLDLAAERRTVLGKKVAKLRRAGVVPANIYGGHADSIPIQAEAVELRRVVRSAGHTGLVRIALEGGRSPMNVLVRGVRRHALTGNLVHVDFQQVSMTERMTVEVPLTLIGTAPAQDAGGVVFQQRSTVQIECLPGSAPQHLEVDVSVLTALDSVIHARDLAVPADVAVLTDPDAVLVSVSASAAEAAETAEAAEAEAAPEEAAEPSS